MQNLLSFGEAQKDSTYTESQGKGKARSLGQYFTPKWAAEELVELFIRKENPESLIEPSCGNGRFLGSIPKGIQACGVELDSELAEQARRNTGRTVIESPFQDVSPEQFRAAGVPKPTHFIGNPPFAMKLILEFLDAIYAYTDRHAVCGFILPAYVFQTANTVKQLNLKWGVEINMIPRDLFPGLSTPIMWAELRKHSSNKGFLLFDEKYDINALKSECRKVLSEATGSWKELVAVALRNLGAKASMEGIYSAIAASGVPETNNFWKEKVRQTLQRYDDFERVDRGVWALAA